MKIAVYMLFEGAFKQHRSRTFHTVAKKHPKCAYKAHFEGA